MREKSSDHLKISDKIKVCSQSMSGDLYLSECFMSDGGVLLPALHEGSSLFDF